MSIDYLLEMTDSLTPEIGTVEEITGLGDVSVRKLSTLKNQSPELVEMIDAIISAAPVENIACFLSQIFNDYRNSKPDINPSYRAENQMWQDKQARDFYHFILAAVTARMAPYFDKEIEDLEEMRRIEYMEGDTYSDI